MTSKTIATKNWQPYFQQLEKTLQGKNIKIEIVGVDLGDQVLTPSSKLLGMTYEPKTGDLDISLTAYNHVINHPKAITVEEGDGGLVAMQIVDQSDRHQIITVLPNGQP